VTACACPEPPFAEFHPLLNRPVVHFKAQRLPPRHNKEGPVTTIKCPYCLREIPPVHLLNALPSPGKHSEEMCVCIVTNEQINSAIRSQLGTASSTCAHAIAMGVQSMFLERDKHAKRANVESFFDSSPCTPMQCRDNESRWWLPQDVMRCHDGSGFAPTKCLSF